MKKLSYSLTLLAASIFTFSSCDDADTNSTTIVDIATSNPNLSILVEALTRADLVSTLDDENADFTVFAPTNAAFTQLLADLGATSLDDISDATLESVLLFHVVSGTVKSTDLSTGYVSTLNETGPGDTKPSLYVDLSSGVKLNGTSNVTTADILADNGVVHIIDKVMLPPTVVNLALSNSNFSILVAALTRPDLTIDFVDILSGDGPFTIFAPTNDAFIALLDASADWDSLDDIPVSTLEAVLKYHVVSGANVVSSSLTDEQSVTTLGGTLTIDLSSGPQVKTSSSQTANIIAVDVQGTNGIIHAVNTVLIP